MPIWRTLEVERPFSRKHSTMPLRRFAAVGSGNRIVKSDRGTLAAGRSRRVRSVVPRGVRIFDTAVIFVFVFLLATPVSNDPSNVVTLRTKRAQELVDQLRGALSIQNNIQIAVVIYHPLVFSVQP